VKTGQRYTAEIEGEKEFGFYQVGALSFWKYSLKCWYLYTHFAEFGE
jgi:hypothetical protein